MACPKCTTSIIAVENKHLECMKINIEIEKQDIAGWEDIEILPNLAAKNGNFDMIDYLWIEGYLFDDNVFIDAYKNYSDEIINYLIENNSPGLKRFQKRYKSIIKIYKTVNQVLDKLTEDDIKELIISKIFKNKNNYIFEKS